MSDKPLPESHEGLLKTALRLEEHNEIPAEVTELYWEFERLCRRVTRRGVADEQIPLLVLLAGHGIKPPPRTYLDCEPKRGDRCIVKWKKDWRWAEFQGFKGKTVLAQVLDDSAEVREFKLTEVRAPTAEELATVGE